MDVILVIFSVLLAFSGAPAMAAPQVNKEVRRDSSVTVSKAKKIAIKEFKAHSRKPTTRISVRLLEDNDKDWVFVVEDEEQSPRPGSELYVTVSKRTAKAESYFGK